MDRTSRHSPGPQPTDPSSLAETCGHSFSEVERRSWAVGESRGPGTPAGVVRERAARGAPIHERVLPDASHRPRSIPRVRVSAGPLPGSPL